MGDGCFHVERTASLLNYTLSLGVSQVLKYIKPACLLLCVYLCVCVLGCDDAVMHPSQVLDAVSVADVVSVPPEAVWAQLSVLIEKRWENLNRSDEYNVGTLEAYLARARAYYNKYINAEGVAIIGNDHLADKHFIAAREVVLTMTRKHPGLRDSVSLDNDYYFILVGYETGEAGAGVNIKEIPEISRHEDFGGSCGQRYCWSMVYYVPGSGFMNKPGMTTFAHEFGHALEFRMHRLDPTFQGKVEHAYAQAKALDRWPIEYLSGPWSLDHRGTFVDILRSGWWEYWAEGIELWFYHIGPDRAFASYEAFAERDPLLAELLDEWFPRVALPWYY